MHIVSALQLESEAPNDVGMGKDCHFVHILSTQWAGIIFEYVLCFPTIPSLPTFKMNVSSPVLSLSSRLFLCPQLLLNDGPKAHVLKSIFKAFVFSHNRIWKVIMPHLHGSP